MVSVFTEIKYTCEYTSYCEYTSFCECTSFGECTSFWSVLHTVSVLHTLWNKSNKCYNYSVLNITALLSVSADMLYITIQGVQTFFFRSIMQNMSKSAFRQNFRTFLAHSSTFCRWVLSHGDAWRCLVAKVGMSNPDHTISLKKKGCSA